MPPTKKTVPKTSAERPETLQLRRAEERLAEVRGLYARPADHAKTRHSPKVCIRLIKKLNFH